MERIITRIICLLMLIGATARAADMGEEYEQLREAKCIPVDLLVELPIETAKYFMLSSTHAYVRRCIGINDKRKACVPKDQVPKMEHWNVVKDITGSNENEFIHVNWVSHETCGYKKRTECPIELARKCHEKSTTHYYDEVNCTCDCIVQIAGEDTCIAKISYAAGMITWLPILTFLLGMVISAVFLYFKSRVSKEDVGWNNDFNNLDNQNTSVIGFSDVEQPAEPPNPPAAMYETNKEKIGFIH